MNYLKQFAIILFVSFLGELLHILIPLPIPASVYGLLLMLLALCLGILRLEQVKETAGFLIEFMPVMFIPAAVGLLESCSALQPMIVPVVVIRILTSVFVRGGTGLVTQFLIRNKKERKEK